MISQLIESKEITKIKYQCVRVSVVNPPTDINFLSIGSLHISLVDINKLSNFQDAYDSIITKNFNDFWDYDKPKANSSSTENLKGSSTSENKIRDLLLKKILTTT